MMFTHIMVVNNDSRDAGQVDIQVLDAAISLSKMIGARITCLVFVPWYAQYSAVGAERERDVREAHVLRARIASSEITDLLSRAGVQGCARMVELRPCGDDLLPVIITLAKKNGADLIVIGASQRAFSARRWPGISLAERMVRRGELPVLTIL